MARQTPWGGITLIVIGVAFLLATLDIIRIGDLFRFWPLILILIGAKLVLESRGRSDEKESPPPPPP